MKRAVAEDIEVSAMLKSLKRTADAEVLNPTSRSQQETKSFRSVVSGLDAHSIAIVLPELREHNVESILSELDVEKVAEVLTSMVANIEASCTFDFEKKHFMVRKERLGKMICRLYHMRAEQSVKMLCQMAFASVDRFDHCRILAKILAQADSAMGASIVAKIGAKAAADVLMKCELGEFQMRKTRSSCKSDDNDDDTTEEDSEDEELGPRIISDKHVAEVLTLVPIEKALHIIAIMQSTEARIVLSLMQPQHVGKIFCSRISCKTMQQVLHKVPASVLTVALPTMEGSQLEGVAEILERHFSPIALAEVLATLPSTAAASIFSAINRWKVSEKTADVVQHVSDKSEETAIMFLRSLSPTSREEIIQKMDAASVAKIWRGSCDLFVTTLVGVIVKVMSGIKSEESAAVLQAIIPSKVFEALQGDAPPESSFQYYLATLGEDGPKFKKIVYVLVALPVDSVSQILAETPPQLAAVYLACFPHSISAKILEQMNLEDAASRLSHLHPQIAIKISQEKPWKRMFKLVQRLRKQESCRKKSKEFVAVKVDDD